MAPVATVWQHNVAVGDEAINIILISPGLCSLWSCSQFHQCLLGAAVVLGVGGEGYISAKDRESSASFISLWLRKQQVFELETCRMFSCVAFKYGYCAC